eukprot:13190005-Ditylum_brightwellii.AAC.1
MPTHPIASMLGMTRDRFGFIWRHFHVQSNTAIYQEENLDSDDDTDKDGKGKEYLVEQCLEREYKLKKKR